MTVAIAKSVGSWQSGSVNNLVDVRAIQTLLIRVSDKLGRDPAYRPRLVNGEIVKPPTQSSTVNAIVAFQRNVLRLPSPDGRIDPGGATINGLNYLADSDGFNQLDGVNVEFRKKVYSFIAKFKAVNIKDGKRTLQEQAALMAPMTDSDLDMYGATNSYVISIKAIPRPGRSAAKVETLLSDAMKKDVRIKVSDHLAGLAVDVSAQPGFDWSKAATIARQLGMRPKNEYSRNCFHISYS